MTNAISSIPSVAAGMTPSTTSALSSTTELVSSFRDILSTMTSLSNGSSLGGSSVSAIADMMTPLMMLILLEKLVDSNLFASDPSATAKAASALSAQSPAQTSRDAPSGRPTGGTITQEFHPGHNGIDFGVIVGTPIKATMDGKVTYAGWNNQGYGNLVIVENGAYKTYYAHLSSIPVSVGEAVAAGTTIGLSGNTGNSTGPHLHYEVRKNNTVIDPTSFTLATA